jgi:hypothetical protein
LIGAMNWRDAGKLGYALGPTVEVLCLNLDARQFGLEQDLQAVLGRDVLIVAPRQSARAVTETLGGAFERIEALPPAMLLHANSPAMPVPIYLGHRLRISPVQYAAER